MTGRDPYLRVPSWQREMLARFRASHPYKAADVGGARWQYLAGGRGDRALLFLAGAFMRADMWFFPFQALEDRYRIVAPDSFAVQPPPADGDLARATACLLEAEGIRSATAVGLSAGGGIAQMLVRQHPAVVEGLVLSHCGVLASDPAVEARLRRLIPYASFIPLPLLRWFLLRKTSGPAAPGSEWAEFHRAYFGEAASRVERSLVMRFLQAGLLARRALGAESGQPPPWAGRVLILNSVDDRLTYPGVKTLQQLYPQASVHLFERGGHHAFALYPEDYTAALAAFLERS